ncbi:hypothetical protein H1C71_029876, partial [Ictidomys tridecemlineatus]
RGVGRKVAARRGAHPAAQTPSGSGEGLGLVLAPGSSGRSRKAAAGGSAGPGGRAEVLERQPGRSPSGQSRWRSPSLPRSSVEPLGLSANWRGSALSSKARSCSGIAGRGRGEEKAKSERATGPSSASRGCGSANLRALTRG